MTATGGNYELTLNGATTAPIAWNASASDVASALATLGLAGLDLAHISVVKTVPGFNALIPGDQELYTITFLTGQAETLTALIPYSSTYQAGHTPGTATVGETQAGIANIKPQIDTLTIDGDAGSFGLAVAGHGSLSGLAPNVAPGDLQNALAGLAGIGAGNVTVSGVAGGPYTITFASSLGPAN